MSAARRVLFYHLPLCTPLHHGLSDMFDNHSTSWLTLLYSSVVPGTLHLGQHPGTPPNQLGIVSIGQTHIEGEPAMSELQDCMEEEEQHASRPCCQRHSHKPAYDNFTKHRPFDTGKASFSNANCNN